MSYVLVEFLLDKTQPVVSSDDVRDFSGVVEDDKVYYWAGDARTKGSFYDAKVLYMAAFLVVIKTTNLPNQPGEGLEENGSSEANDGPAQDFSDAEGLQMKSPQKSLEPVCFFMKIQCAPQDVELCLTI
ncbi:hypothetical protein ISCGN_021741 [Ixodes scapularis]